MDPLTKLIRFSSQSSSEASSSPEVHTSTISPLLCRDKIGRCELTDIGSGKYGQVFQVNYEGKTYAAKEYFDTSSEIDLVMIFSNLLGLKHENITTYHNVYNLHCNGSEHTLVFMDLFEQNLPAVVENASMDLDSHAVLSILNGIASGLNFLHNHDIFHCDLIPNNVLVTSELRVKIADFGNTRVKPIHFALTHKDHNIRDYLPPEASAGRIPTAKVDVFSFGHLIIYVILGRQPHPLEEPVFDEDGVIRARSEVQRREKYITEMYTKLEKGNLQWLLEWTKLCLNNNSRKRPQLTDFIANTES